MNINFWHDVCSNYTLYYNRCFRPGNMVKTVKNIRFFAQERGKVFGFDSVSIREAKMIHDILQILHNERKNTFPG